MQTDTTSTHVAKKVTTLAIGAVLAGCAGTPAPETPNDPGGAPSAEATLVSFNEEQVARGYEGFRTMCGECHSTGEFRGRNFQFRWRRQTAWDFYREVTTTMPENAPGALTDQEYVDIVAYILELNGFEPGESELPATEAALDHFVMDSAGKP
ncbi:MAG: c-type cytochrome [Gemmatimonadetes bacterium]|nr:c-type cytochrome [Gemmatimonadota bacterium]